MPYKSGHNKKRKEAFLKVFNKNNGLVSSSCREFGINRSTYYDWRNEDPEFAAKADEVNEFILDQAETVLQEKTREDTACLLFYLKCKGKKRGYVEKQQIEHSTGDLSSLRDAMNDAAKSHEGEY